MHTVETPTDESLREAIREDISRDSEILSRDIHVAVTDGVVTLTGFAHSYFEKLSAEEIAKRAPGVRGVANDIAVHLDGARTDPELAREVVHALRVDPNVPQNEIKITVRNGYVSIHGTVDRYAQKREVEEVVSGVTDLKGVTNHIVIRPVAPDDELDSRIAAALRAQGSERVSVTAEKGIVTLNGHVRTSSEKMEAERVAWSAPGVCFVENLIALDR